MRPAISARCRASTRRHSIRAGLARRLVNRQCHAVRGYTIPECRIDRQQIDDVDPIWQIGLRKRLGNLPEQIQSKGPLPLKRKVKIGVTSRPPGDARSEHEGPCAGRKMLPQNVAHYGGVVIAEVQGGGHPRRCRNWSRRYATSARKSGMQLTTCSATEAA